MKRDRIGDHSSWDKDKYSKNMSQELGNLQNTDYVSLDNENGGGDIISPTSDNLKYEGSEYKVYKWRWYVLTTLAVLNFSNAMAWICFAVVTNITAAYYDVSADAVNWLSLIFLVVTVPIGFVASWAIDTLGLRAAMLFGGWTNLIGLIIRYFSTLPTVPDSNRFAIVMTGQGLAAFSQPFLLFAPTKLAALWFPDQQRAIANTIGSMSNPVGILCSFLLSAGLVSKPDDIPFMLWVYIIPGGIAAAMVTFGMCSATPPSPPTASAASEHESFFQGLKKCVKNLPYMMLCLCFGAGYGLFNALSTFLEQIVCPQGYNDDFAGLIGGLMLICGLLGAIISGLYVDRTKQFTPVVKITFTIAVLFGVIFIVCAQFPKLGIGMAVGAVGFGFFGFAMFPIALELGVECTYPVAEGCSAGILQISGQCQGIILIMIGQFAAQQMPVKNAPVQQCVPTNSSEIPKGDEVVTLIPDMSIPLYIFAGYSIVSCVLLLLLFKTKYKRVEAEEREQTMIKPTQS